MTPKKFIAILILQFLFLGFVKAWFFKHELFGNPGLQEVVLWAIMIIIAAALVRRFGPITFLECFVAIVAWILVDLLLDLVLVSPYTGLSIFRTTQYWAGLGLVIISISLFHKMKHIHVREQLHAKH